ncbi:chromatin modification-related protein MEAF6 isoform X2 [Poecile atricapillus]|uniref:chromatin modification-related protein MEAF6 isoform X2 n=1 Tax=Poecile atricapillus TaxID=48891 RepID=UPI0027391709|nr:chromatin modification-related protein MEAF6 isoform X2 [Poecile atricapillus]
MAGCHGPAARTARARLEAAPALRLPRAPGALRDGAARTAGALEPDVGPADVLQELLGRRLPGHRAGNSRNGKSPWPTEPRDTAEPGDKPCWHQGGSPDRAGARGSAAHGPTVPTVRVGFQLGIALQLRLERSEEEEDVDSDSAWEPGQTVVGQQRHGDASEAVLRRLEALEADVRFLCTELGAEKLLWSSRFLELLREQQSLRQRVSPPAVLAPTVPSDTPDPHTLLQLQELPWRWNSGDSPELLGEAEDQSASGSEGESPEGCQWMEAPQQPRGSIQRDRQKM